MWGGGWFEIHCCKECSGNLIEICGYPDPQKTWHFDACESFVEFLSSSDQTKMTATWKMWLLSEINIWNVRGWGGLKFTVARSLCEIIKLSNLFLCQWLSFLVQWRSDRQGSSLALVKIWLLSEINDWNVRGGGGWNSKTTLMHWCYVPISCHILRLSHRIFRIFLGIFGCLDPKNLGNLKFVGSLSNIWDY